MSFQNEQKVIIDYLKHHPQHVPVVAQWIVTEWGDTFSDTNLATVQKRVETRTNDDKIPLTLIALMDGEAVGTAAIKLYDMDTRLDLSPWLAGVYVREDMRGKGIGGRLVKSIEENASKLGIRKLYLFTADKRPFYEQFGWVFLEETDYRGEHISILTRET